MTFTKAGINLSNLGNITQLDLNLSLEPASIVSSMINSLNSEGGIWAIGIVLIGIYTMFLWTLSETSPFSTFRYSYLRASLLALCMINLISVTMISIGIIESFRIVAIFVILNILNTILVLGLENK
jgi:hypothetical protein